MSNLRNRLAIIGALIIASLWALFPRDVVQARVDPTDSTTVYDTVSQWPIKRGLDLAGGMYLALEVDEERQRAANQGDALERALTVLRRRIDPTGVGEAELRRTSSGRITVELP